MTGLNPKKNKIIEIATLVTNNDLKILSTGPVIAIYQSEKILKSMDIWNINIHTKSGLINRVKKSKYSEKSAELKTINFLKKWTTFNTSPMCGNSIHQDKYFLSKYMPYLKKYFHYRHIDVSTLKELIVRWKPHLASKYKKKNYHSALNDIKESIKELLYYRKNFIK